MSQQPKQSRKESLRQQYLNTQQLAVAWDLPFGPTTLHEVGSEEVPSAAHAVGAPCPIKVLNMDTVALARTTAQQGKTCLLNMASPKRPGGGVRNGASAQEESLFRSSNLFQTLESSFYPLRRDQLLYSEQVTFFKDRSGELLQPFFQADVVTAAADNLRQERLEDYAAHTTAKIETLMALAVGRGCDYLVLGAWGCGVFQNSPYDMAAFFRDAIRSTGADRAFQGIAFAVVNDRNARWDNYRIFKDALQCD